MIPYGRQYIDEEDIKAVTDVLKSDWLTTGPKIVEFENLLAEYVGAKYAIVVSSGTAALHSAMFALGIGPGDEVIVPPMSFAATANCVVFQGGIPIFVDVDPDTLLLDPAKVEEKIDSNTKAILTVDYAGQPCDYDQLRTIATRYNLSLITDGCHALGAEFKGLRVGRLTDMTCFSFHPVKHITTGEGGAITTDDPYLAKRMREFRNHGITADARERENRGTWYYQMVGLGYNYRISDIQCALGASQLKKISRFLDRRRDIAAIYDEAFIGMDKIIPLAVLDNVLHAYHLYVVRIIPSEFGDERTRVFKKMREQGLGVNVHYIPIHLHPYYTNSFGTGPGLCPIAERAYEEIISLPIFPLMADDEVERVIQSLLDIVMK